MDLEEIRIRWIEILHLVQYYTSIYPQINHDNLRNLVHTVIPLKLFERLTIHNPNLISIIEKIEKEE